MISKKYLICLLFRFIRNIMFHQNLRCKVCKKVFCSPDDRRQHEFKRHEQELLKMNKPFAIVRKRNFSVNLPVMPDRNDLKYSKAPKLPVKVMLGKRKYQSINDNQSNSEIKTKAILQRAILIPHYRLRKLKSKLKTIEEEEDLNNDEPPDNEKENLTIDVISPIQNITNDGIEQKMKSPEKIFTSTPITEQTPIEETKYETAFITIPSPSSVPQSLNNRKHVQATHSKKVLFSEQIEYWSEYKPPKEKSIFKSLKNSIYRVFDIFSVKKLYKRFSETDSSPSGLKGVRILSHPYSRIKGRRSLYKINPPLTKYID